MPSFKEIMDHRNQNNHFCILLGIRTTQMDQGSAKGEMPIREHHENAVGSVHGGCIFSLADTIGGSAAASYGHKMTTLSSDFHYLTAAMGTEKLYTSAREIKHGKRICVFDVEVSDDKDRLIAKGTFSYFDLGVPILDH